MEKVNHGINELFEVARQYKYVNSKSYTTVKTFVPLFDNKQKTPFVPDTLSQLIGGSK